jgi:hypothetical protein
MRRPKAGASEVRVDLSIILELWDTDTGVDQSSVVIKVDDVTAWTGDAQQSGFTVTKAALTGGGVRYEINPDSDFRPNQVVSLAVYAEDLETTPNVLDEQIEFSTGAWE